MLHSHSPKAFLCTHINTDINTITKNVGKLCEDGRIREALTILQSTDSPHSTAYASLLRACNSKKRLPEGKLAHAHIIQTQFQCQDIFLTNTLINMYVKCGNMEFACKVFEDMPERNVVSWTAMIAAYAKHGLSDEALNLFSQMQEAGVQPNEFTFAGVLPVCASLAVLEQGKKVHERIITGGFESNVFVGSSLVDMYVKCGSLEDARQVFDKMSERDVVSWTAMVAGYAQGGLFDEALELFHKMPMRDAVAWNAMIAGCAKNGNVGKALEFFEQMPERNVVSWNAMIAGFVQNRRIVEALELFGKIPERDVVSWNVMIGGFVHSGQFDEALRLFQQMQVTDVKPNLDTLSSVLPACANLVALEQGKEIHRDVIKNNFQSDVFVGSALVDMYAKCGAIEDARKVFDKMCKPDVVSWNAMIVGYAVHGCGREALKLFEQMRLSGTNPDKVTFIGVLSSCCNAGLVDDGWRYFDQMSKSYGMAPIAEHYCAMVDLLGRAGHLDDARDFIDKMPIKADAAVWGSLLGACRMHKNIELGKCAAECLLELEPENAAPYVMLSNIYAASGEWNEVEKVRKMMKDRKVKKMPGCSWIEVNSKVHTFLVGDRSHPQTEEIYAELEKLYGKIKDEGYMLDADHVLHDVEEEQKEHNINHHSEKLAIAFGIIHAPQGTPIRIVKNLRVCADCHLVTKLISKIIAREIIVRDSNRFHHFKGGQCSCGDYW
jgi:pentatricopeptide repeat protein